MDKKIIDALTRAGFFVEKLQKLTAGSYNTVYKAKMVNGYEVVVRIFRSKSWPEEGKLEWISRSLSKNNILNAKILFSTKSDDTFPNGFMVQEYVDGEIVQLLAGKQIMLEDYFAKLGKLMKTIHSIELPKYGYIGRGTGNHSSLLNYIETDLEMFFERITSISKDVDIDKHLYTKLILKKLEVVTNLPPVLTHNDLSPNNVMLNSRNELVLIDWDNAVSHIWVNDFAVMTYWMRFSHKDEAKRESYIQLFLEGYKPTMNLGEIRELEKTLHFIQALNLLGYYYFEDNDKESYSKTLSYFYKLKLELL